MEGKLRRAAGELWRPVLAMTLVLASMFGAIGILSAVKEGMVSSSVAEREEGSPGRGPVPVIRILVERE